MYTILLNFIPGIKKEVEAIGNKNCSYKMAAFFSIYTKKQIRNKNYNEVKNCFKVADAIIRLSSAESKHAIENVYLFSLSFCLDKDPELKKLFPAHLNRAYEKQLTAPGI